MACGVRCRLVEPLRVVVDLGLLAWAASVARRADLAAGVSGAAGAGGPAGAGAPPCRCRRPASRIPVDPVLQRELSITLLISVTAPLRASRRPMTVAPLFSEMLASAIRLPWKAVVVPSVAELPICQ